MFIRSERLFLRPGWPEDWSDLAARIADEAIVRNLAMVPWPYTGSDARAFLARESDPRCPGFLVTLPTGEGSELVGCAGLSPSEDGYKLGYWIARAYWGQGYATEAARATLSVARALGHRRIVAEHFADNPASGRVLTKLGFKPTGGEGRRYSLARGTSVPAQSYVIELDAPCGDDDPAGVMTEFAA